MQKIAVAQGRDRRYGLGISATGVIRMVIEMENEATIVDRLAREYGREMALKLVGHWKRVEHVKQSIARR